MNSLYKFFNWYFSKAALPYWCIFLFDCLAVLFAGVFCYALDHGINTTVVAFGPLMGTLLFYLIFFILGFRITHTYSGVLRYSSFSDLYRVGIANLIGVCCVAVLRWVFEPNWLEEPLRVKELIFMFILATGIMCSMRIVVKYIFDKIREEQALKGVFIYGVKSGGIALAKSIRSGQPQRFVLRGFVSDADDMTGHMLQGVQVFKNDEKLVEHMKEKGVGTLLVSPLKRSRFTNNSDMVNRLIDAGILIYMTDVAHKWDENSPINPQEIKEVDIEDLLPRDEIQVNLDEIEKVLKGKKILITGSAGSIGSEIVRQVAKFAPQSLMLIDEAETPQHDIRLMMARDFADVKAETVVTSITNEERMEHIFQAYQPDFVFHAAAYKHVPMMEDNPSEAVLNNIKGTRVIADLSVKYGVKKFVMISTDKAVNPTNVMGCSKRICEIYCQSLNKAILEGKVKGSTEFVTTRFGNVLGSNGSVIPLFREQIKKGGPVTVTHPDIIRFFMLIPEACKLVLEAGTMGNGGEIFVFDMGKPVKIAELARRMIQLSGATNVEVKFTGLRDGEKLYEEVLNEAETTKKSNNEKLSPKIKVAKVREYDYDEVCQTIQALIDQSLQFDDMETVRLMKKMVPEYISQQSDYEVLDKELAEEREELEKKEKEQEK
ncbi:MAG: polysaccharide biosynthesis protein [Bacteroidaceae bacterium]|nr:polysaccharide biosynthesis protein [Bacteroidaceae bacterium]